MSDMNTTHTRGQDECTDDFDPTSRVNAPEPLDLAAVFSDGLRTFGRRVVEVGTDVAGGAGEVAAMTVNCFRETWAEIADSVSQALSNALHGFGDKPGISPTVISRIVQFVPIIGSAKSYASAWNNYHEGVERNDAYLMEEGRVGCLVSLAEAGIDIGAFGIGRVLNGRRAGAVISTGLNIAMLGRVAVHGALGVDVLRDSAKQVLQFSYGRTLADTVLNLITPASVKVSEPPVQAVPA